MKGELIGEERDNKEMCKFLIFLKSPKGSMPDNEHEMQANEWKQVFRRAKNVEYCLHFQ